MVCRACGLSTGQPFILQAVVRPQKLLGRGRVWKSSEAAATITQAQDDSGLGQRVLWRCRGVVWIVSQVLELKAQGIILELHNTSIIASSNQGTLETRV